MKRQQTGKVSKKELKLRKMVSTQMRVSSALGLSKAEENKMFFGFETEEEIEKFYKVEPVNSVRSYPEEYHLPNGKFSRTCQVCDKIFFGFRGRLKCKVCVKKESEVSNG